MILAPVGAGKTAIALTAMDELISKCLVGRFLVVAPLRVAVSVWPTEAKLWAEYREVSVAVGTPKQRLAAIEGSDAQIVVTNYDNLQWLADHWDRWWGFDAVVFDELTRLKNPSGARFKAFNKVITEVRTRWGLTGSFTSNGLEEIGRAHV